MGLTDIVFRPENAVIIGAISAIVSSLRFVWPEFDRHRLAIRYLPLLPLLLGVVLLWIPGIPQAALGAGDRVLLGLTLGGFVMAGYKVYSQTLRGRDARLEHRGLDDTPPPWSR